MQRNKADIVPEKKKKRKKHVERSSRVKRQRTAYRMERMFK